MNTAVAVAADGDVTLFTARPDGSAALGTRRGCRAEKVTLLFTFADPNTFITLV